MQIKSEIPMDRAPVDGKRLKPKRPVTKFKRYNTKTPAVAPVTMERKRAVGTITLNFHKASMAKTTAKVDITAVETMPGYLSSKAMEMVPKAHPSVIAYKGAVFGEA